MTVDWEAFTWEAFATLMTGASAVIGAVCIGIRQSAISHRQTEILHRQVSIEELRLRSELFDRRFAVYEATEAYLAHAIDIDGPPSRDIEQVFFDAKKRASFLFSATTQATLKEIATTGAELMSVGSKLRRTNHLDGTPDWDLSQRQQSCLEELSIHYENLAVAFGGDMQLFRSA